MHHLKKKCKINTTNNKEILKYILIAYYVNKMYLELPHRCFI